MGSISGVSGQSNAWVDVDAPHSQPTAKLFTQAEATAKTVITTKANLRMANRVIHPKMPVQRRIQPRQRLLPPAVAR